jgi:type III pantothenate kinase
VILAIDSGNTRLKWGLHPGWGVAASRGAESSWESQGALPAGELHELQAEWSSLPQPRAIVVSNVAGPSAREAIERALRRFDAPADWVLARASQCGVTSAYAAPQQLGSDRWAALIGARRLHQGPCLVVNAGTATTIDLLAASGLFRGGAIIPGLELMKRSLAEGTAGLALARGEFSEEPRNTADAIETGCLQAQAGAIERMYAKLDAGGVCLLSGGAALRIAARLGIPVRVVENLALEGLVRIACP